MTETDAKAYKRINPKILRWRRLVIGEGYNDSVRTFCRGRHGVYAVRDSEVRQVLYVGESHTGRLWKTMLRHFQAQASFRARNEWTYPDAGYVDVQIYQTRTGVQAQELEPIIISRLQPLEVRSLSARISQDVPF